MAFTQVTILGQFTNIDGTFASGTVAFRLSAPMSNQGQTYTPEIPLHSALNTNGQLSCILPANDDGNLATSPSGSFSTSPSGCYYVVTLLLNNSNNVMGSGSEQSIVVTSAAPIINGVPTLYLPDLLAGNT